MLTAPSREAANEKTDLFPILRLQTCPWRSPRPSPRPLAWTWGTTTKALQPRRGPNARTDSKRSLVAEEGGCKQGDKLGLGFPTANSSAAGAKLIVWDWEKRRDQRVRCSGELSSNGDSWEWSYEAPVQRARTRWLVFVGDANECPFLENQSLWWHVMCQKRPMEYVNK